MNTQWTDEWIKKIMGYYLVIKKNESESVLVRWMNLEPVVQSEVSQKEKNKILFIDVYIWNLEKWH